jgi:hypothetical protein
LSGDVVAPGVKRYRSRLPDGASDGSGRAAGDDERDALHGVPAA